MVSGEWSAYDSVRCSYGYIMYSTAAPTDQDVVESGLDGRSSCCATLSVYAILKAAPSAGLEPARETQPYLAFANRTTFLPHPRLPIYTLYRPAVSTPPSSKFMTLPCYTTMLHNRVRMSLCISFPLPTPSRGIFLRIVRTMLFLAVYRQFTTHRYLHVCARRSFSPPGIVERRGSMVLRTRRCIIREFHLPPYGQPCRPFVNIPPSSKSIAQPHSHCIPSPAAPSLPEAVGV